MQFDKVLRNATVITMDKDLNQYNWVAIRDGKIAALGNDDAPADAAEIIDLQGQTVLPGLSDCHLHIMDTGKQLAGVDLFDCTCVQDILDKVDEKCLNDPQPGMVCGTNLILPRIKEGRFPTRYELDRVSHGQVVAVYSASMHSLSCNTKAYELARVPDDMPGVLKEDGVPNGIYVSDESGFYFQKHITAAFSDEEILNWINICLNEAVSKGCTGLHGLFGQHVDRDRDATIALAHLDEFPLDLTIFDQTWNVEEAVALGLPRVGGCLTLDGAAFEHTMAMFEPYYDAPHLRGVLYHNDQEVYDFISSAHAAGLQATMHAVGSRAIDQLLYTYRRVFGEQGRKDLRHRLEHFCEPTEDQIRMAKEMDIILSMQPSFSYFWDGAGQEMSMVIGREKASASDPYHKAIAAGITVIGGSDSPVAPIDPLLYIAHCVNGYNPVRNISVTDAIRMFTTNAAYAAGKEDTKGSIEIGKDADLTVASLNPYEYADSQEIFGMHAVYTIYKGNIVYQQN